MSSVHKINNLNIKFDLISFAVPIIDSIIPLKYSPNRKYDNKYYFICLLDIINCGYNWSKYRGTLEYPISGKYLNSIHNKFVKNGIYEKINEEILKKYLSKGKEQKLKYQYIDSTFVANKNCSIKNNNHLLSKKAKEKNEKIRKHNNDNITDKKKEETFVDFNRYNGRKNYIKISRITDSKGVPLSNSIISSKQHDCISIEETVNNIPINLNTLQNSKSNRFKQTIIADAGYHSKKNIKYLKSKGYSSIIAYNKRNTKDKIKIAKNKLKDNDKKLYSKRFIIEASFSWSKRRALINQIYQKTIESYLGLVILDTIIIISKNI